MAIGPISGSGPLPPVFQEGGSQQRTYSKKAVKPAESTPIIQQGTIVRTYSVIRIDESNMVTVKVFDADTDQLLLEAPPGSVDGVGETMRRMADTLAKANNG